MATRSNRVDEYAHRNTARYDEALGVHIDHPVSHNSAGDAQRGPDGHRPDAPGDTTPAGASIRLRSPARTSAAPTVTPACRHTATFSTAATAGDSDG